MTTLIDTDLLADVQRFGAADVSACFSCGNCTATCPLADNDATFPRRIIRYAQVGLKDQLLSSKELWTCYHCGCAPTAARPRPTPASSWPRAPLRDRELRPDRAGPAAVHEADHRLAHRGRHVLLLRRLHVRVHHAGPRMPTSSLALFEFIPEGYPLDRHRGHGHDRRPRDRRDLDDGPSIGRREGVTSGPSSRTLRRASAPGRPCGPRSASSRSASAATARTARTTPAEPLYRRRWLIHALTIWGFLGLFAATSLDCGLRSPGSRRPGRRSRSGTPHASSAPSAGLALLYGVTMFAINRCASTTRRR